MFLTALSFFLYYQSIHIYEESHCEFEAPWTTLVAFKDVETRNRWYRSPAEVELDLSRRILTTKDGKSSLRYFDGATMKSYQSPPPEHLKTTTVVSRTSPKNVLTKCALEMIRWSMYLLLIVPCLRGTLPKLMSML